MCYFTFNLNSLEMMVGLRWIVARVTDPHVILINSTQKLGQCEKESVVIYVYTFWVVLKVDLELKK